MGWKCQVNDGNDLAKRIMERKPEGMGRKGRTKLRGMDGVNEDLRKVGHKGW